MNRPQVAALLLLTIVPLSCLSGSNGEADAGPGPDWTITDLRAVEAESHRIELHGAVTRSRRTTEELSCTLSVKFFSDLYVTEIDVQEESAGILLGQGEAETFVVDSFDASIRPAFGGLDRVCIAVRAAFSNLPDWTNVGCIEAPPDWTLQNVRAAETALHYVVLQGQVSRVAPVTQELASHIRVRFYLDEYATVLSTAEAHPGFNLEPGESEMFEVLSIPAYIRPAVGGEERICVEFKAPMTNFLDWTRAGCVGEVAPTTSSSSAASSSASGSASSTAISAGGSSSTSRIPSGQAGGPCYGNGSCNAGLTCNGAFICQATSLGSSSSARTSSGLTDGQQGGACYGNMTCNAGLTCNVSTLRCEVTSATSGTVSSTGTGSAATGGNSTSAATSSAGTSSAGTSSTGTSSTGTSSAATSSSSSSGGLPATVLRCDGLDDYAEALSTPSLNLQGPITLEAWVLPARAVNATLMSRWAEGGYSYVLEGHDDGRPAFFVSGGGGGNIVKGGDPMPVGRWAHIAASYDGVTMRMFVDGSLVGTAPRTGDVSGGNSPLNVCARRNVGNYFIGDIDEARISEGARYTGSFVPPAHLTSDAATRGLWLFDADAADSSGNGNHLTLHNGAQRVAAVR